MLEDSQTNTNSLQVLGTGGDGNIDGFETAIVRDWDLDERYFEIVAGIEYFLLETPDIV